MSSKEGVVCRVVSHLSVLPYEPQVDAAFFLGSAAFRRRRSLTTLLPFVAFYLVEAFPMIEAFIGNFASACGVYSGSAYVDHFASVCEVYLKAAISLSNPTVFQN